MQDIDRRSYDWCKQNFYSHTDISEIYCKPVICPITAQLFGMKPCDCNEAGSENVNCNQYGGRCQCKINVEGRKCDSCVRETWGLSNMGCQCK